MTPPTTILVLTKHRFLGDTVVATPLLRALRSRYPQARQILWTGTAAADLLRHSPLVDEIVAFPADTAPRGFAASWRLSSAAVHIARDLRRSVSPDWVIVADRSLRAAMAARLCGGRIRAGFATEFRSPLLTHRVAYDPLRSEARCLLQIAAAVDPALEDDALDARPQLMVTDSERIAAARHLSERGAIGPLLIGVQPGASEARKCWSPERFATVADALARQRGARIVLIGGPKELVAARAMQAALPWPACDLTGALDLRETMAALSHCALFLSADTGVRHIAAALEIPTIGLFGPTCAEKWGSRGPQHATIRAADRRMDSIAPDEVLAAALRLLPPPPPLAAARRTAEVRS
jgi:ADP-heptose:LPS heptosyltransferase